MTMAATKEPREAAVEKAPPGGEVVPIRHGAGAMLPRWMERFEELFAEAWPPYWPVLRFPEEMELRAPPLDVYEEGGAVVVKAEVPGMKKEEVEVHVTGRHLTISGHKEKEEKVERTDYRRIERSAGAFTRTVTLPGEVESEKATATLKEGVLEVRLPRMAGEAPRGRRIEVT